MKHPVVQRTVITRQYPYRRNRRQRTNMLVLDSRRRMVVTPHYTALFLGWMTESNHRWCYRSLCRPWQLQLDLQMTGVVHLTKSEQLYHSGTDLHGKSAFVHRHSSWIDTNPMKEFYRKSLYDLVSKHYWYYAEARWLRYNDADRSSHCNPFGIKIVRKIKEKQDLAEKC